MSIYADKTRENKSQKQENCVAQKKSRSEHFLQLKDHRPEMLAQTRRSVLANNSPQDQRVVQLQTLADDRSEGQSYAPNGVSAQRFRGVGVAQLNGEGHQGGQIGTRTAPSGCEVALAEFRNNDPTMAGTMLTSIIMSIGFCIAEMCSSKKFDHIKKREEVASTNIQQNMYGDKAALRAADVIARLSHLGGLIATVVSVLKDVKGGEEGGKVAETVAMVFHGIMLFCGMILVVARGLSGYLPYTDKVSSQIRDGAKLLFGLVAVIFNACNLSSKSTGAEGAVSRSVAPEFVMAAIAWLMIIGASFREGRDVLREMSNEYAGRTGMDSEDTPLM